MAVHTNRLPICMPFSLITFFRSLVLTGVDNYTKKNYEIFVSFPWPPSLSVILFLP